MNRLKQLAITLLFVIAVFQSDCAADLTFAVWSDSHFGAFDFKDETRLDIIDRINGFKNAEWPASYGISEKKIDPDFLIHCGDITENGKPLQWNDPNSADQRSYLQTIGRLDPSIETYAAVGNHDSRKAENCRKQFAEFYGGTYYSFDKNDIHFVVLDPYPEMNSAEPSLDKEQLKWLRADLAKLKPNAPIVIVMHVLPVMDEKIDRTSRLDPASSKALAKTISGKNILAFLRGHWHARSVTTWQGIPIIAPAGFAYYVDGCKRGEPYLGVIRITDSDFNVYSYNWHTRSFDEKPFYQKEIRPNRF